MANLRFGVVGVGEMGKRHAENLRFHVPGAELTAIADANPARAQAVAAELGIAAWYATVEELVSVEHRRGRDQLAAEVPRGGDSRSSGGAEAHLLREADGTHGGGGRRGDRGG